MKIHEYQARELLQQHGIDVPPGIVIDRAVNARAAFEALTAEHGVSLAVVKAQVHAGGRGKGGGVKLVRSADEAEQVAARIFDNPLITPQTGPTGVDVAEVLITVGVDIAHEFYVGIAMDRGAGQPVLIASREGGIEIEQVAATHPDAIEREPFCATGGLQQYQARKIAFRLGFAAPLIAQVAAIMQSLARLFLETDASLAEINPLVLTPPDTDHPQGRVVAIDAKINFDDNALFRNKQIQHYADFSQQNAAERRAEDAGLSYIKLDGSIGCLVNGAGLAMATMDLIKLHGSEPANFLDVGGSASEDAVTEAFRIILEDQNVKGVLVNIFGGIMRCDVIARAIVQAAKQVGFEVPLVVRLEGTNVKQARQILQDAQPDIPSMQIGIDLTDAARKITGAGVRV